jgi:cytoskeletal protein CcmA (bactofilin family)
VPKDMKRMNYFDGLLLKQEDLILDQQHHKRLQRLHNRYFHNWGVVSGLKVEAAPSSTDLLKVEVSPGLALNRIYDEENQEEISQEILISDTHPNRLVDLSGYSTSDQIYITVGYKEVLADKDLPKGGGAEIHIWEMSEIKAGSSKPEDPRKDIILARVTLKHNQDGSLAVGGIYDKDTDGTPIVARAVGSTVKADKMIIGSKEEVTLPYLSNTEEEGGQEGSKLFVHAPATEFTGAVRSGSLETYGNAEIKGELTVKAGSKHALKVNQAGDVEITGSADIAGPLSAKNGIDVSGGLATLDVPQVIISGSTVTLNKNPGAQSGGGLEVCRENRPSAKLLWDETDKAWKIGTEAHPDDPSSGMHTVAYGGDWDKLHQGANADKLHQHSGLHRTDGSPVLTSDEQGDVRIERSLTVARSLIAGNNGLEIKRGDTLPNARIAWNEAAKKWQTGTADGKMTDIPDGEQWEELTGGNQNADALHTHRQFHNEDRSKLALEIGVDGNVHIPHELMVGETLTVNKLIVREEEVLVRKVEQEVTDSFLTVNKGDGDAPVEAKGGLNVYRGSADPQARLEWNETDKKWKIGVEGSLADIPYGSKWDSLTSGGVAEQAHKHSSLSTSSGGIVFAVNEEGQVTASGDAVVKGALDVAGGAAIQGGLQVGGSAMIDGDLTVKGKTTFIDRTDMVVRSSKIELNKYEGETSAVLKEGSIEVYRGSKSPSARLVWDEASGRWKLGLGTSLSNIAYGSNWDVLTGGVSSSGDGLHTHSFLNDSAGNTALTVKGNGGIEIKEDAEVLGTLTVNNGADIAGSVSVDGSLTIDGNLTVKGKTTTVEKEDLVVAANMIEINKFEGDTSPVNESGLEVYRGESQPKALLIWNETERKWKLGIGGALENIASGSSWEKLTQGTNADALHIHSQLYNPQNDVLALSANAEGDVDVHHDLAVGGNLTVTGGLDVRGATASLNTDELHIGSPLATLNKDGSNAASADGGGIEVYRGTGLAAARLVWNEAKGQWQMGTADKPAVFQADKDGNVTAAGGLQAAKADIKGAVTAASAAIAGTLSVGDGLEVPQGTETKAQIKWAKDRWKLGTADKTVLSLTRSGRMGIGTDNPTEALDVAGKALFRTEMEVAGAATFSGAVTAQQEATFNGAAAFNKPVQAADVSVSEKLTVAGRLITSRFEAPRGQDDKGKELPTAKIEWDNDKEVWFYGNGVTRSELGTPRGGQNKLYNELADTIAICADKEGKVGIGTIAPLALLDVRTPADTVALGVTKDGNVGIGTAAPKNRLDVQGAASISGKLEVQGAASVSGKLETGTAEIKGAAVMKGSASVEGQLTAGSALISKDLTVSGNLTVNGDVVTINTTTLEVEDNIIRVNKYEPRTTPLENDGGLEVYRGGTELPAQMVWSEAGRQWVAGVSDHLQALEFKGHTHPEFTGLSGLTSAISIDAGNIGIGNPAPAAKLDVSGDARISGKVTAAEGIFNTSLTALNAEVSGSFTAKDAVFGGSAAFSQGITTGRGTKPKARIVWDETVEEWQVGVEGSLHQLSYSGHTHQELSDISGALKVKDGNIGIGTSAPAAKLDVSGNAAVSGKLTVNEVAVVTAVTVKDASVSSLLTAKDAAFSGNASFSQGITTVRGAKPKARFVWDETLGEWQAGVEGSLRQLSYSGHTHQELTDLSGALKIKDGNLGIGTSAPAVKLDVNGDAAVSGKLTVQEAAVATVLTVKDASVSSLLTAKDAAFSGTLTAKDATISGILVVQDAEISGGLSVDNAAVSGDLVAKDALITGHLAVNHGLETLRGTDPKACLAWDETEGEWLAGVEGELKPFAYKDHSHEKLTELAGAITVDSAKNVGIGKEASEDFKLDVEGNMRAANFSQTSSRSFKENISGLPAKRALELLGKLKPVTFQYLKDSAKRENIGFIAEEVPDSFTTADGKSVVLMDIIGVLTSVVKKQQNDAADMQRQLKALQKQVAGLTAV